MSIDEEIFDKWMNLLVNRFDLLESKLNKVIKPEWDGDILLDNQDLLNLLKVSPRTLQRLRSSGQLPFRKIKKKNYYLKSEIEEFLKEYCKVQEQEAKK